MPRSRSTDFAGRTSFITGAGSGIGRALAEVFAAVDCNLMLSDIDDASVRETARMLDGTNRGVETAQLDVADRDAVESLAADTIDRFGSVDFVINNAGVALGDDVADMTYDDFAWLMSINFWGVVHGCKAFLPHMKARGSGHIVNMSSLFGLIGVPGQSAYCASKFAVRGFTETLRLELAGSGVSVHIVHPGGVATNIARDARGGHGGASPAEREANRREFESLLTMPPEKAAEIIRDGIRRGDPRIVVGNDAKRADFLSRLMPRRFGPMLLKQMRKKFGKTGAS